MLDMSHIWKLPDWVINPTIKNETVKIDIISRDRWWKIEIPVRIIRKEVTITQYMFLVLLFDQYTNA